MPRPISIVTVNFDSVFYIRLLVEKVREFTKDRPYEILVVDRGSTDGSREWLQAQADVTMLSKKQWRTSKHTHGKAAEMGVAAAKNDHIVLMDSDAHPTADTWLVQTVDRLDEKFRLAGAQFHTKHRDNPYGWYIHPHFMAFRRQDFGSLITLRKVKGQDTDTAEDSTVRVLDAGLSVAEYPMQFEERFSVGHPAIPTVSAGVFHAWYSTRLIKNQEEVHGETKESITRESYSEPLQRLLRRLYGLDY
jgi:glycosyltransferase involved in cell wall biosynthesis